MYSIHALGQLGDFDHELRELGAASHCDSIRGAATDRSIEPGELQILHIQRWNRGDVLIVLNIDRSNCNNRRASSIFQVPKSSIIAELLSVSSTSQPEKVENSEERSIGSSVDFRSRFETSTQVLLSWR